MQGDATASTSQGNGNGSAEEATTTRKKNTTAKSPLLALLDDPSRATLIKQGAEAKAYKITSLYESSSTPTPPLLLKHRFSKAYRHASLDGTLTKQRIAQETKCLARCLRAGVDVPSVKSVDVGAGVILMEWIEGHGSVREVLGGLPEDDDDGEVYDDEDEVNGKDERSEEEALHGPESISERLRRLSLDEDAIMASIGRSIASMHAIDVIHGDLTTSNMLLRSTVPPSIVLIDFGLSYVSSLVEDKAVDLYVLERALASTHPEEEGKNKEDTYIEQILRAYAGKVGEKEWSRVERRLKDVRLRGRKRSMVG